jgi:hypothetical protein
VTDLTTEELDLLDDLLAQEIDTTECMIDSEIEHPGVDHGVSLDEFMETMADNHERINTLQVLRAKLKEMRDSG